MKKQQEICEIIRHNRPVLLTLRVLNLLLTIAGYLFFLGLIGFQASKNWLFALRIGVVAAIPFVVLSLIRRWLNDPRPYEVWGCEPLVPRRHNGKSFPSRHVFSMALIGTLLLPFSLDFGFNVLCYATILAVIRVLLGVHFPKDVIVGMLLGVIMGGIGCCFLR